MHSCYYAIFCIIDFTENICNYLHIFLTIHYTRHTEKTPMSLKHAILSMVISQPKSGYDIAKEFSGSVNFYWAASHQQIYKTLSELEKNEWLNVEAIEQTGKPDKKNYGITAQGKKELLRWVERPTKRSPMKNSLLIKLLTLEEAGSQRITETLLTYKLDVEKQLAVLTTINTQCFPQGIKDIHQHNTISQYIALRRGIFFHKGEIAWLEEALDIIATIA